MFNPIIAGRLSSLESGSFFKTTKVVVADKAEVLFADFGENNLYISDSIDIMQAGPLTEGTPITVHFDGINYANEVKTVENDDAPPGNGRGNFCCQQLFFDIFRHSTAFETDGFRDDRIGCDSSNSRCRRGIVRFWIYGRIPHR